MTGVPRRTPLRPVNEDRIQAEVDRLAERFECPVVLEDEGFHLVAFSAHTHEVDRVRTQSILTREAPERIIERLRVLRIAQAHEPVVVPEAEELGMAERICIPLRAEGHLVGYLWLVEHTGGELAELAAATGSLADLVAERSFARRRDSELLSALLLGSPGERREAERLLSGLRQGVASIVQIAVIESPVSVAHSERSKSHLAEVAKRAERRVEQGELTFTLGDRLWALIAVLTRWAHDRAIQSIEEAARATGVEVVVGLGDERSDLTGARASREEAEAAALVARHVPEHSPVARFSATGSYGFLGRLGEDGLARLAIPSTLLRLKAEDSGSALLTTLRTYLDCGCDARQTASALQLHRGSLYRRLRRIEEVASVDLADGDTRLLLHLALRAGELTG